MTDPTEPTDASHVPDVARIAAQNDRFRRHMCAHAAHPPGGRLRGTLVFTRAVAARGTLFRLWCMTRIAAQDVFPPESDPDGWHDFGAVEVWGETVWWKVDLYADEGMTWGSERPDDPAQTYRLLTVMLPSDW